MTSTTASAGPCARRVPGPDHGEAVQFQGGGQELADVRFVVHDQDGR
ncbi:hypothetical protein [Nocardiopsis sp. FIRDI 009]|nr:hypothetical protein [Nocardiopsis sp. FIRDI 009]